MTKIKNSTSVTIATNLSSSNIERLVYYHNTKKLKTRFTNGNTYIYSDVTLEEFEEIIYSDSVGKKHNELIVKGGKQHEKK